MKAKRVSKIASGRMAKSLVLRGRKERTKGGLTQESLMRNKRGKVVSKKKNAAGKRLFKNIGAWVYCLMDARKALKISGFCAVNGQTPQGRALYVKCRAMRAGEGPGESA